MAAIIKLSQNEWVKVFFVQMVGTNLGKCDWVWEETLRWLNPRWPNSRWQNSRWLPSSSWVRMNKFESEYITLSQSFVQNGWIQDGRIQDGSDHQVNQIELVWGRVEGECFWVNLRKDKKVSESKMAVSEFNMLEIKMAAIIKLSQNQWVKVFFVQMVGTILGKCEWVWEKKLRWLNPRWWNSRWLPSSSWVRMNERRFFCANGGNQSWQVWVSLREKTKVAESKMAQFKMAAIIKLSQNDWVWVRLN